MTYLVLARKWRPRSFDTLVGQDHVVRALTTALSTQRLHHAWLFTGTRGVGKTTLSRILAKALNCQEGITPTPCGQCAACTGIEADRYVDYLELDAASNRGVEEMTRLLEQAVYAPSAGRFKVYMIDEVHMLTGHAFNAMLKTLEEPPPHVKFILATTDPQKIPVTVLSRCLQFNLKQMPPEAIAGYLEQVLEAEGVAAEPQALRLIGQAARGSMRDALSLTDQAIAYSGGNMSEEAVRNMLGVIDQRYLVRLLDALAANDGPALVAVADELAVRSLSYSAALGDLAALLAQIAMAQRIPGLPTDDTPLVDDIRRLAGALSDDAVQLFYSIALHSRPELALAPDEYAGFVMACLRMLAFAGNNDGAGAASVATQGSTLPHGGSAGSAAVVADSAAPSVPAAGPSQADGIAQARAAAAALRASTRGGVASVTARNPVEKPRPASEAGPAAEVGQAALARRAAEVAPASETRPSSAVRSTPETLPAPEPASAPEPPPWEDWEDRADATPPADPATPSPAAKGSRPEPITPPPVAEAARAEAPSADDEADAIGVAEWPRLATRLPLRGMASELARQAEWVAMEGDVVELRVATRALAQGPSIERLRDALSKHFGRPVQLRMQVGQTGGATAHAVAQSELEARQRAAEAAIAADPFVQTLVSQFGGEIVPGSIRPA